MRYSSLALVFALFSGEVFASDSPAPELSIVNAGSGGFSLSRSISRFEHAFIIESKNKSGVADLHIEVPDFVGPDGVIAETKVTVDGKPLTAKDRFSIEGLNDLRLTVSAALTQSGGYETSITLIYGETRKSTPIKVSRTRNPLDLAIESAGTAVGSTWTIRPASVDLWLTVVVGGRTVVLEKPAIRNLTRKSGSDDLSADFAGLRFALSDQSSPVWPMALDPASAQSIRVTVDGLTSPGTYQGTLIFPSRDHTAAEASFSLNIRRAWFEAAAVIAFGLLVSLGLRHLQENVQPRLRQQVDVLNLLVRLRRSLAQERQLTKEDQDLITAVEDRLSQLYADLRVTGIEQADDIVDEIAAKLPLIPTWININVEIRTLPEEKRRPLHKELMEIGQVISEEGTSTDQIKSASAQLNSLKAKVAAAAKQSAAESVGDLPMEQIELEKLSALARVKRSEITFNLAILGIAIVLGLYLLWSSNSTWGTPGDLFVAFLWGLGLHTITAKQKFEGLGDLAGRFSKP